ncbi:PREDICTED: ankyrin repeat, SAM and basic leucine zipper domain-containing protein 1 [Hipposideros armiger]|uniref:Ankyrin repeat, SAM and basic leucine zipper domain-containing protein 1 n=1 Tax=Hipposideros armiger TaxID=186990 RepID=A0A8B7SAF9_HIPAR|nr:PREDICTED: ankyrin repeat, SAM and basic leucine zipper domain-containing protein 1 [Hipposideros armiger]
MRNENTSPVSKRSLGEPGSSAAVAEVFTLALPLSVREEGSFVSFRLSVSNVDLVRVLLDRGANASFDKDKQTVLITACSARGSEERILKCVELLLSRNADPNVACRRLMTPIMYAARDGHTQVVALLVAHGAEVNTQDENGYTALTWAARQGHKNVVLKLLELGANKMLQTKDGKTPSEIAKRNKHLEIYSFLSLTLNPLEGKLQQLTKEDTICKLCREFLLEMDVGFSSKACDLQDKHPYKTDIFSCLLAVVIYMSHAIAIIIIINGDEFLNFLLKLNKQCRHLITAVQNIITELPVNSHKIVLEWASPRNFTSVCEELVSNVEDLNEEVCKLKDLIQKLQNERENDPTHIPLIEEVSTWNSGILKRTAIAVCGVGFLLFICKLTLQRK